MRRRRPGEGADLPPELVAFDPADWWVDDLEDPIQLGYARIRWFVACKVYREGGDWQAYMQPPEWSTAGSSRPVAGDGVNTIPIREGPGGGVQPQGPNYVPATHRARPMKLH